MEIRIRLRASDRELANSQLDCTLKIRNLNDL